MYYHVDCTYPHIPAAVYADTDDPDVGRPRAYKWINTINLAKSVSPLKSFRLGQQAQS